MYRGLWVVRNIADNIDDKIFSVTEWLPWSYYSRKRRERSG